MNCFWFNIHSVILIILPCVSLFLLSELRLRILFTGHNQITYSNANSSYENKLKPVLKDKHKASYLLVFSQRVDAFALCMVGSQRPHESNGQQCFCYRNLTLILTGGLFYTHHINQYLLYSGYSLTVLSKVSILI